MDASVHPTGLTTAEAAARRAQFGPNTVAERTVTVGAKLVVTQGRERINCRVDYR